ncbi:MAG TPA: pentapeptide repeat-containing protein [Candidatus Cybelea sp.]|nr:pentapeptide repeat-containing protein [Candidatus Cybelea sp.]
MKPFFITVCAAALAVTCLWRASAEAPRFCEACNYAGAALSNSDFTNGALIAANFKGATLDGSSFRGARLVAVNFEKADLRNTHFDSADCVACNFAGAQLDGATFSKVAMVAANFKGFSSSVQDAELRQLLSGCISCNFSGAYLSARDLSGVTLISVDLSQADLRGTDFTGAVLCWYQRAGAQRVVVCDAMHDAITTGAKFDGAQLCDNPLSRIGCVAAPADTLKRSLGPKPSASPESP